MALDSCGCAKVTGSAPPFVEYYDASGIQTLEFMRLTSTATSCPLPTSELISTIPATCYFLCSYYLGFPFSFSNPQIVPIGTNIYSLTYDIDGNNELLVGDFYQVHVNMSIDYSI